MTWKTKETILQVLSFAFLAIVAIVFVGSLLLAL